MSGDQSVVEIYIAADPLSAHRLRVELEGNGIAARVVGDLLQGGAGDLPLGLATSPAVWVASHNAERARQIAQAWEGRERDRQQSCKPESWICPSCGETIDGDREVCPGCSRREADERRLAQRRDSAASDFTPLFENRRTAVFVVLLLIPATAAAVWFLRQAEPRTPRGIYNRGWERYEAGNYRGAIEDFERCLFGNIHDAGPYTGIAASHYMLGEFEAAVENYTRALNKDPTDSNNHLYRGLSQYWLGRDALAAADLRRALSDASEDVDLLNNLAWILATSPDDAVRDSAEALRLARRADRLAKDEDGNVQATLAAAQAATGDYESALRLMEGLPLSDDAEDIRIRGEMRSAFESGQSYIDAVAERRFEPSTGQRD